MRTFTIFLSLSNNLAIFKVSYVLLWIHEFIIEKHVYILLERVNSSILRKELTTVEALLLPNV